MGGVGVDRGSQLLGSCLDRVDIVCLPEKQIGSFERQVVAEAWGRVDCDESALGSAVEDVARRQVAMQEGCWRDAPREPGRLVSAFVQLQRDQFEEFRVALGTGSFGVE